MLHDAEKLAGVGGWLWYVKSDTWIISDNWMALHGCSKNSFTTDDLLLIAHPEDRKKIQEAFAKTKTKGEPYQIEHRIIRQDNGKVRNIRSTGKAELDAEGNVDVVLGTALDITDMKKAEQSLKEHEHFLFNIFQVAPLGLGVMHKRKFTFFNNQMCEITGYTEQELINQDIEKLYETKKEYNRVGQSKVKQLKENKIARIETKFVRKDGKTVDILLQACYYDPDDPSRGIIKAVMDITEQKDAEKELQESEKKFRSIFENAALGIFRSTPEGKYEEVNTAFANILGFDSPKEMMDKVNDISGLYKYPEDRERIKKEFAKKGFVEDFEIIGNHPQKETVWISVNAKQQQHPDGHIYHEGTIQDITERKLAEEKLRESQEEISKILENSMDAILLTSPDGSIYSANPAACELFGRSEQEICEIGKEGIVDSSDPHVIESLKTRNEQGAAKSEVNFFRKDGTTFPAEVSSALFKDKDGNFKSSMIIRDITERRKAEKELLEAKEKVEISEERFRKAQEVGHIGSWEYDIQEDTFWGSKEGKKIYNLTHENDEFSAQEIMQCVIEQDRNRVRQAMVDLINENKPYDIIFTIIPKNTSERRIIRSIAELQKDENGNPVKVLGVLHDITLQKNTEKELIEAKEKAEEADQLKSAFLANMSHEIRTPMNGILGFANLLKEPSLSSEELNKYIDIIERSGERMLGTVNDLIDISKIETGQETVTLSDVDINEETKTLETFFEAEAKKKGLQLSIEKILPVDDSIIRTDKTKFNSVFSNLIKNAIKYTKKGFIKIGAEIRDDYLHCYVKDSGIGIPKHRQQAVFNRFEQADIKDTEAFQGSGLGLAISKGYIEMLNGEIGVESEEGKGSTFWFTLPASKKEATAVKSANKQTKISESPSAKKPKILIAEDDEASIKHLRVILKHVARELLFSVDGLETVDLVRKDSDIDIVLMDIKMPGADGYEATRKIREFNKDVVIIAQTAYAMEDDHKKALEAGCDEYITKPIQKEKLIRIINQAFKDKNKE